MLLDKLFKQPAERLSYEIDYSPWLQTGETVTAFVTTVTQQTGGTPVSPLIVDAKSIKPDGLSVVIFVSHGDDSASYLIDVKATTSTGQIKEDTLWFNVGSATGICSSV